MGVLENFDMWLKKGGGVSHTYMHTHTHTHTQRYKPDEDNLEQGDDCCKLLVQSKELTTTTVGSLFRAGKPSGRDHLRLGKNLSRKWKRDHGRHYIPSTLLHTNRHNARSPHLFSLPITIPCPLEHFPLPLNQGPYTQVGSLIEQSLL